MIRQRMSSATIEEILRGVVRLNLPEKAGQAFTWGYELGQGTSYEPAGWWREQRLYGFWLVPSDQYAAASFIFAKLRRRFVDVPFVASVEVEAYLEGVGHGFVDRDGEVMLDLKGQRWVFSFNSVIRYDHERSMTFEQSAPIVKLNSKQQQVKGA